MIDPRTHLSRRDWMRGAAATAGLLATPGGAWARRIAPSDRVNVAVIGAGGMGAQNMTKLTSQNIVAVADVDFGHVAKAFVDDKGVARPDRQPLKQAYDRAANFADYRRMLDSRKDIDAVVIATPDHHHAIAAKTAMERGLHVYVQKPLTYTVREGRTLLDLARRNPKLVTQMGNQGHSGDDGRRVVELIRSGVIGRVRQVHARPIGRSGRKGKSAPPQCRSRPPSTGTCGSDRRTSIGATIRTMPISTGAAGSRSASARLATWVPISSTSPSGRWSRGCPRG